MHIHTKNNNDGIEAEKERNPQKLSRTGRESHRKSSSRQLHPCRALKLAATPLKSFLFLRSSPIPFPSSSVCLCPASQRRRKEAFLERQTRSQPHCFDPFDAEQAKQGRDVVPEQAPRDGPHEAVDPRPFLFLLVGFLFLDSRYRYVL